VESSDLLPSATAVDWATYADALVVVTVASEREIAPTPEEVAAGEGLIGRVVNVALDEVLWHRDRSAELPPSMEWDAGGWVFSTGQPRRQMVILDAADLLIGHRYLVPLVRTSLGQTNVEPTWMPLSATAILPYDGAIIGDGVTIKGRFGTYDGNSNGETPVRDSLWKRRGQAAAELIANTRPDSRAAQKMTRDPVERLRAVQAGSDPAPPGPGEK
jgi:hypothetical protein